MVNEDTNLINDLDIYLTSLRKTICWDTSLIVFFNNLNISKSRVTQIFRFKIGSLPFIHLIIFIFMGSLPRGIMKDVLDIFINCNFIIKFIVGSNVLGG